MIVVSKKRELMTFNEATGRWFKKFEGKQYVVSPRTLAKLFPDSFKSPTKEGSYKAANDWWVAKLTTLAVPAGGMVPILDHRLAALNATLAVIDDERAEITGHRIEASKGRGLRALSAKYVSARQAKCSAGQYDSIRRHLAHFFDWLEGDRLDDLTSSNLIDFKSFLEGRVNAGQLADFTARDRMGVVWGFITDLWEREILQVMPRVSKRKLTIETLRKEIVIFSKEQVTTLLGSCQENDFGCRRKLYYLLMLNCGMYAGDISDLKPSEVDWERGTITRKRSKTKKKKNTPTVCYKLWAETFELLKKFGNRTGERVLTTTNGTPLVWCGYRENGAVGKNDYIAGNSYKKIRDRLILPPLKCLRKTSATMLDEHPEFSSFAQHFLGHAPSSMMDQHYRARSQTRFDAAVKWLGEQFGIE